jgi:predicted NBD/HSP70 family sugar kinase
LSPKVDRGEEITVEDIIDAINHEDLLCIELIEELGQKLGRNIASLINVFNPEMVIIGGALSAAKDYILQPTKLAVRKYSLNLVYNDTTITCSKLHEKAGVVGACLIARSRMFEQNK